MPIELHVNITSPLTADDHELLSGVSVMLLAVANHELAKERFPEAFGGDEPAEETAPEPPAPCGMENHAGSACVREDGHRGRHRFRPISPDAATALVN
jgi:hypothetical protein